MGLLGSLWRLLADAIERSDGFRNDPVDFAFAFRCPDPSFSIERKALDQGGYLLPLVIHLPPHICECERRRSGYADLGSKVGISVKAWRWPWLRFCRDVARGLVSFVAVNLMLAIRGEAGANLPRLVVNSGFPIENRNVQALSSDDTSKAHSAVISTFHGRNGKRMTSIV